MALSKGGGMVEISEIISDTELKIKREFKSRGYDQLLTGGARYKVAAHVDHSQMYRRVFQHLRSGNCVGIFPEGGSHDRPDLLPIKAGVAIMALGALAEDQSCNVQIVPCGMNYFHPHKFRSRAVIEFGDPISVPPELIEDYVAGGDRKRHAVKSLLDSVTVALKSVTVTCDDYDTLMAVQAARRLYHPQGKKLPLPVVVEMTRKFVEGYNTYKDHPRVKSLRTMILQYNKDLRALGVKDHQVMTAALNPYEVVVKLVWRSLKLIVFAAVALPGLVLFAPVFVATKVVSRKKAAQALKASTVKIAARDVIATWKVLVAMGLAPLLYCWYAAAVTIVLARRDYIGSSTWTLARAFVVILAGLASMSYGTLFIGERGVEIFKSLRPLALAINPTQKNTLEKLKQTRQQLTSDITEVVNTLGPELYPEFDRDRVFHGKSEKADSGEGADEDERDSYERPRHYRQMSNVSTASTSSDHDISRVNSESDLANIQVFSNVPESTATSPVMSRAHSRGPSGPGQVLTSRERVATGQNAFQSEVTQRIRSAMAKRQKERAIEKADNDDE
jgi:glycerol-3-phosphate O-acyltransferase/dihydroxyacetone phosphate acyltransferase